MTRKSVSILLSLLLILAAMPVPALGTTIGADVTQNLPIESRMETIADAVNLNTQLAPKNGSAALVQDKTKGKYAVKTTVGDVYGALDAEYDLASSGLFAISDYSQVSVWVKPAAGAKTIQFFTYEATILGDANNDGIYQVGKDLVSGKWNQVKLDLTNTNPKITQGFGLRVKTNDISTWYFDEITSNTTTTFAVNLSRLKNSKTQTMANGSLQFIPTSNGAYDTTPTVLMSESKTSFSQTETTQTDFQSGIRENTTPTSTGDLELAVAGVAQSDSYTKLLMHMDGADNGTVFSDEQGKPVTVSGNVKTVTGVRQFGTASAYFDGAGDYLTLADSPDWNFGSGDFTIDFWMNPSSAGPYMLVSKGAGTSQDSAEIQIQYASGAITTSVFYNGTGSSQISTPNLITAGTWHHVAVVRAGANLKVYIDGVAQASTSIGSYSLNTVASSLQIGLRTADNFQPYKGNLDELRISKGIARWSPVFTPPNEPYTVDESTTMLAHMDGANNGTVITDDVPSLPKTASGSATTSTARKKFGTASARIDYGDSLAVSQSENLNFGAGDFTIDCWAFFDSLTSSDNNFTTIFAQQSGSDEMMLWYYPGNQLRFIATGTTNVDVVNGASAVSANAWHHLAVVRSGNVFSIYVDGVLHNSRTVSTTLSNINAPLQMGLTGSSFNFCGNIDEFRVSKGIARWTSNFTPSSTPYTPDAYTELLLHMDGADNGNAFTCESGSHVLMTRVGSTVTKTGTKMLGSASASFNGTTDFLTLPDSDHYYFGTNDFAIDGYVYFPTLPSDRIVSLVGQTGTVSDSNQWAFSIDFRTAAHLGLWFTEYIGGTNMVTVAEGSCTAWEPNRWYHVAVVRNGNTWTIYRDGQPLASTTSSAAMNNLSGVLSIGSDIYNGSVRNFFYGYIDELRISKGVARHSCNFTPAASPYSTPQYKPSGTRISEYDLSDIQSVQTSMIRWTSSGAPGTSVSIQAALSVNSVPGAFRDCANGQTIPGLEAGTSLINTKLLVKQTLTATTDQKLTPQLNDLSVSVSAGDYNDSPALPNGKITRIFIDSTYVDASTADSVSLQSSRTYLEDAVPTKFALSGDGSRLVYKDSGTLDIDKLCVLDLKTGNKIKLSDTKPVDFKVNYDGTKIAFRDSANNLYLATYTGDPLKTTVITIASGVTMYEINKDGKLSYYKSADTTLNIFGSSKKPTVSQTVYTGNVTCFDLAGNTEQMYFSNTNVLSKVALTPAGWRFSVMSTVSGSITGLWANSDGSMIFLKQADGNYYVYEAYAKGLRRLGLTASAIVRITDDNRIVAQDADYNDFIYDPETDERSDVRPEDAKVPSLETDILFDVDQSGKTIAYVQCNSANYVTGTGVAMIGAAQPTGTMSSQTAATVTTTKRPERYLFSFDGKNSWLSYKDGDWTEVCSGSAPEKLDFDKYGMTIDQVNKLTERDFAGLYEDGRQVFTFDVAVWFASVNPYITPSLNGITVTLSRSNNGFGNELTEKALFAAKQQTFDGANWRKVRKVYPVELSPKDAEMYYFIKLGEDCLTYKDNVWQTVYGGVYDNATGTTTVSGTPLLDDVEANWINITFKGMSAAELRAIPEAALTEKLANKSFAVVYCMKVLDETTKEYKSQVHVDYVEGLFNQSSLTLNVIYNDGKTKQYTGLTNAQVEDFMQWVSERQFNRGPVFYRIKVGGNNDFINYYMIQSVNVLEQ
ncbi:MAG: LamG domain-containing protein [Solirubrobacterales bacterium]